MKKTQEAFKRNTCRKPSLNFFYTNCFLSEIQSLLHREFLRLENPNVLIAPPSNPPLFRGKHPNLLDFQ